MALFEPVFQALEAADARYVVVGGVAVVLHDAKLEIQQPTLFAVTIEKPGVVVVSSRERLPLLAQVG